MVWTSVERSMWPNSGLPSEAPADIGHPVADTVVWDNHFDYFGFAITVEAKC
jgi:hypothetical protein